MTNFIQGNWQCLRHQSQPIFCKPNSLFHCLIQENIEWLSELSIKKPPSRILNPQHSGHLFVLGRSWKRRFCVLKNACLYIYSDISTDAAIGKFGISLAVYRYQRYTHYPWHKVSTRMRVSGVKYWKNSFSINTMKILFRCLRCHRCQIWLQWTLLLAVGTLEIWRLTPTQRQKRQRLSQAESSL